MKTVHRNYLTLLIAAFIGFFAPSLRADTSTIGIGLMVNGTDDSSQGQVYINIRTNVYPVQSNTGTGRATTFKFFDNEGGSRSVTPLIFEKASASQFILRGVGTSRVTNGSGIQQFPFGLVAGTDVMPPNYVFGFTDRALTYSGSGTAVTTASQNAGSVDWNVDTSGVPDWFFTPSQTFEIELGQTYNVDGSTGGGSVRVVAGSPVRKYSSQMVVVSRPELNVAQVNGAAQTSGGVFDFGYVRAGASYKVDFTVANNGTQTMFPMEVSMTGANAGDFAAAGAAFQVGTNDIPVGTTRSFSVTFTPQSSGAREATLTLFTSNTFITDFTPFTLTLRGSTNAPPALAVDGASGLPTVQTLAAFATDSANPRYTVGNQPRGGLMLASDGQFYGTNASAGNVATQVGTVFRFRRDGAVARLADLTIANGWFSTAALVEDSDGNLLGTGAFGGANLAGTIFKVTPAGTFSVLHHFQGTNSGTNGGEPRSALVKGAGVNFFSHTRSGGSSGTGIAYSITKDGGFTPLTSFSSVALGVGAEQPIDSFREGGDGFGYTLTPASSNAAAMRINLTTGALTKLSTFPFSASPVGMLALDADGNFRGTTFNGGANGTGIAYTMTPAGVFTKIADFPASPGPVNPMGDLVRHTDGDFYGVSSGGGAFSKGTLYKMSAAGVITKLVDFDGTTNGETFSRNSPLLPGPDGDLYGVSGSGGPLGGGTVFKVAFPHALAANEGGAAVSQTGRYSDIGGGAVVISASTGTVTQDSGARTWSWNSGALADGPATTNVTITATDAGGATDTVTFPLTVANVAPVVTLGGAQGARPGVAANFSFSATDAAADQAAGFAWSINWGDGSAVQTFPAGTASPIAPTHTFASGGSFTISVTATDKDGGVSTAATRLIQVETTPPVLANVPGPLTVEAQGPNGAVVFFGGASATDNSGITPTVSYSPATGATFAIGTTPVTVTATDAAGNTATASFNITVQDTTPPDAFAPIAGFTPLTVAATPPGPGGMGSVPDYRSQLVSADIVGVTGATQSPAPGASLAFGTHTITLRAQDAAGNLSVPVTFDITVVQGSYPPVIATDPRGGLQTSTRLTYFAADNSQGKESSSALILGHDGNYYGTAKSGGSEDRGTIVKMTPAGVLSKVADFTAANGGYFPHAELLLASDGNYYGTTGFGGPSFAGTIFKLTPDGTLTTLANFTNATGYAPKCRLVEGADGALYGTTEGDNNFDRCTIFKCTKAGVLTAAYVFNSNGTNGAAPIVGLTLGRDGNFYGVCSKGGAGNFGTIFRYTPAGVFTKLAEFTGANGSNPRGRLLEANDGNFYGTTQDGGTNDLGVVYKMTPAGVLTKLADFDSATTNGRPSGDLIQRTDGNLYGTTILGFGSVFKCSPFGTLTRLLDFTGGNTFSLGVSPHSGLTVISESQAFVVCGFSYGASSAGSILRLAFEVVESNEATPATFTGTFSDQDGNATVTLSANVGTVTQNNVAGTWSWTGNGTDGPALNSVVIAATDDQALTATTTFDVPTTNSAPTAGIVAPATANEDAAVNFSFTATDPSAADNAAGFAWSVSFGDGTASQLFAVGTPSPLNLSHAFPEPGSYNVNVTATDKDGTTSAAGTHSITILDVTPPVITPPATVTVSSPDAGPVVVNFPAATATDNSSGVASITYSPVNGSSFPVGTTPVTVTAMDVAGNSGNTTFNVIVLAGPEIGIQQPVGDDIASGGTIDFGTIGAKVPVTFDVTILNTGATELLGLSAVIDGVDAQMFSVTTAFPASIAPGDTATFSVQAILTGTGDKTAVLSLTSSDADEAFYQLVLTGTVGTASLPKVASKPASGITTASATLNGVVNAKGVARDVTFELTAPNGAVTTLAAVPATLSSTVDAPVTALATGLAPHTEYVFRVLADSTLGNAAGKPTKFTTATTPPVAVADSVAITGAANLAPAILANDTDADPGDATGLFVKSITTPLAPADSGKLALKSGVLTFTPSEDFTTATFGYQVADAFGGISTAATVTLTTGSISVNPPNRAVSSAGESYDITVTANGPWSVTQNGTWFTAFPRSGNGNGTVRVNVFPNKKKTQRAGEVFIGSATHGVLQGTVTDKPTIGPVAANYDAIIGEVFELAIPTVNGPATYTTKGLPRGLKMDSDTGSIVGTPTLPGTSNVTITAKNFEGPADQTLAFTIVVHSYENGIVGDFEGRIAAAPFGFSTTERTFPYRSAQAGARIEFTVSKTGVVTGKMLSGKKGFAFKSALVGSLANQNTATFTHNTGGVIPAILTMTFDAANNVATGTFSPVGGGASAAVSVWRDAWAEQPTKAAPIAGGYTFYLRQPTPGKTLPQGFGHGAFTVNAKTGLAVGRGNLADGTTFDIASFVGQRGELLIHALTPNTTIASSAPFSLTRGGFVGGIVTLTRGSTAPANNRLAATLDWAKFGANQTYTLTETYRHAFGPLALTLAGGTFVPPAPGRIVMDLDTLQNNARLRFTGGGLDTENREFSTTFSVSNPKPIGGKTNIAAFTTPPNGLTLSPLKLADSEFSGGMKFTDNFPTPLPAFQVVREVGFSGQFVTTDEGTRGYGFFLLPTILPRHANLPVRTSAALSGAVLFDAAP